MGNTTWDHDKDKRLLVTILNISGAVLDYEAIATKMGDCSAEAVRQHLRALNRKNGDEAKDAPVTPTGTKATPKPGGHGHKKKVEEETPTKATDDKTPVKRKRGRPSKAEKAKETEAEPQKESTEEKEEDDTSEGPKKIAKLEETPAPAAPAEEA